MHKVLTLNAGSSSIRFAIFEARLPPARLLRGNLERAGSDEATLSVEHGPGSAPVRIKAAMDKSGSPAGFVLDWLASQPLYADIAAAGHRVVHGMLRTQPEKVTPVLLDELKRIIPFDPEHLPREIELITALHERRGTLPQVACFDTAFHRSMPLVATQLAIPRRYASKGVQRYGFHGLSYTYLMQELTRLGDPAARHGRVILAHLGSGASVAAVRDGACIDTSMGFTPTAGLVMGTRSGDLDPGLMSFLQLTDGMTPMQFQTMVNHESGMLGVSETSADARDLLARERSDPRAAEALGLFCQQAKKWIGSFAAVLGGIDTLVFSGGIGEHAAPLRERICDGLGFLGIRIDPDANARQAPRISTDAAPVTVRVMGTDEESVIASETIRLLELGAT
jgi:acetate kinase